MNKRGLLTWIGASLAVLAFVAFAALFEHFAELKDEEWLRNVLPFELGTRPGFLSMFAISCLLGAWLLLRAARRA